MPANAASLDAGITGASREACFAWRQRGFRGVREKGARFWLARRLYSIHQNGLMPDMPPSTARSAPVM
jgi:hypothetical protein